MPEPLVSVIMPIRNEEAFIARSLGAVLSQDYPSDCLEILVADGQSDDRTLDVIRGLAGSERVKIVPNPRKIQAAGLNEALKEARGEYVIRVDGHTVIAADYVRQCVMALQAAGVWNVGGPMNPAGITPMGQAIAAAGKSPFAVPSAFHVSDQPQYTDTVYMGAWPRFVFNKVGGFNEQVGVNEDYELNIRIRQAGGKIYFSPAIQSQYFGRQTLGALARQYFRYGQSKVKTLRQHPASVRPRQLAAPALVVALIGGLIGALFSPVIGVLWVGMIAAYAAVALIFALRAGQQAMIGPSWRLPMIFATIHLAWGAGFWAGLFQR